jgi:CxxC motif-containing protein
MRKHLVITMALGALIALTVAGIATAEKPVKVRAGNLELTFNGGFTPKTLSKTKLTPISLNVEADIKTVDGTHPPALKEFNVETDKNGAINVKGLPVCTASKLQSQDTKHAEAICKSAIIGSGQATAEIAFPEQAPIPAKSKIIAFNGGFKGGVTTFFVHAYLTVPTPAAIVTTVKVKKIHNGRYGLEAKSSIPKIAGGSGSVTHFNLAINKKGVLSAKCPDGKLQAHGTAVFSDGTRASAEIIRTCTGK